MQNCEASIGRALPLCRLRPLVRGLSATASSRISGGMGLAIRRRGSATRMGTTSRRVGSSRQSEVRRPIRQGAIGVSAAVRDAGAGTPVRAEQAAHLYSSGEWDAALSIAYDYLG